MSAQSEHFGTDLIPPRVRHNVLSDCHQLGRQRYQQSGDLNSVRHAVRFGGGDLSLAVKYGSGAV